MLYKKLVASVTKMLDHYMTDKCTAECEMCCFACSPQKNNVMDVGLLRQIIDQAAKMPNINTVGFSGGEVFLQYDILVEMAKYASKQELRTMMTLNTRK